MRQALLAAILCLSLLGCGQNPFGPPAANTSMAKAAVARAVAFNDPSTPHTPPKPKPGDVCQDCRGTGQVGDGRVFVTCGACGGTGRVPAAFVAAPTPPTETPKTCGKCGSEHCDCGPNCQCPTVPNNPDCHCKGDCQCEEKAAAKKKAQESVTQALIEPPPVPVPPETEDAVEPLKDGQPFAESHPKEEVAAPKKYTIWYFYSDGCPPCERVSRELFGPLKEAAGTPWQISHLPGYHIRLVKIDEPGGKEIAEKHGIDYVPAWASFDDDVKVDGPYFGHLEFADIKRLQMGEKVLQEPDYPTRAANQQKWSFPANKSLLNHLLTDPAHSWKYDPEWLKGLEQAELESLHADDHEGRVTPSAKWMPGSKERFEKQYAARRQRQVQYYQAPVQRSCPNCVW